MNSLDDLPEDVMIVLMEILCRISEVSIIVFAHVSKSCYRLSKRCAIQHKINRKLLCHKSAAEGSLEVLKWARSNGCVWDWRTCAYAAQNGHLEVLKWTRSNDCEWNSWTCIWAALNGHLEVLKWATSNGCDLDSRVCFWAAENGHLEVLKWARSKGCNWSPYTEVLAKQKWPNIFSVKPGPSLVKP